MQAVRELRAARRSRRLGDIEWFDVAYRVYLAAFFGGGLVIVVSDTVGDTPIEGMRAVDLFESAPGALGALVMVALALGLRSGADGGPVAMESADVRHLMLAPVSRRLVLARPLAQRSRSVVFAAAVVVAVAGQLAAQRLPGSAGAWAAAGAVAGAATAASFVAAATIAHAFRLPRAGAGMLGAALVALQIVTARSAASGPGDPIAHLALLGWRRDPVGHPELDAVDPVMVSIGLAMPVVLLVGAFALVGRLRIEALVRRGALVSQLRFAVTVQDLRTVIVLRRQLRSENPRARPWFRLGRREIVPAGEPSRVLRAGVRRGLHGTARTPAARLVRMTALSVAVGASAHMVLEGTTPMLVVTGALMFLLGLDALEPLSQEVDHPNLTDGYPNERGLMHLALLIVPAALLVPAAVVAAAVVALLETDRAAAALVLAVPLALVGLAGATVAVVRDSAVTANDGPSMVPPEFAGFGTAMRTVVPVAVSMLATIPLLAVRAEPTVESVGRSLVGATLVLVAVVWWIRKREGWGRAWSDATTAATASAREAIGAPSDGKRP